MEFEQIIPRVSDNEEFEKQEMETNQNQEPRPVIIQSTQLMAKSMISIERQAVNLQMIKVLRKGIQAHHLFVTKGRVPSQSEVYGFGMAALGYSVGLHMCDWYSSDIQAPAPEEKPGLYLRPLPQRQPWGHIVKIKRPTCLPVPQLLHTGKSGLSKLEMDGARDNVRCDCYTCSDVFGDFGNNLLADH